MPRARRWCRAGGVTLEPALFLRGHAPEDVPNRRGRQALRESEKNPEKGLDVTYVGRYHVDLCQIW